ncbi:MULTISPECIES: hypothetical protein [Sporomusaceae]|uniref:hypothetical protein n=1 Tax=Sporomusaceae TaxID=1843490 RepID=UPI00035D7623|nr:MULTISPECIES: hypothetical protein [Sporomusaceae]
MNDELRQLLALCHRYVEGEMELEAFSEDFDLYLTEHEGELLLHESAYDLLDEIRDSLMYIQPEDAGFAAEESDLKDRIRAGLEQLDRF